MKRQSVLAIGLAVVLGLVAVFLVNTYLTAGRKGQVPEGMVRVAVAAIPLDYGTDLKPENIRFINYPQDALPAGSFHSAAELLAPGKRRVALAPIAANEIILPGKITGPGANASIAALLPDGKRAVSVRINDVSGVAGFVQPNDSVDVLITREIASTSAANSRQQLTDVLLQNTRVIAMGQRSKNPKGKPEVAKTATLEVSPIDAQKLALGQQVGDLSLVLRKPGQQEDLPLVETVSLSDLRYGTYGSYRPRLVNAAATAGGPVPVRRLAAPRPAVRREQPRTPRPVVAAAPATKSVDVVRGTAETSYEVGGFGGR